MASKRASKAGGDGTTPPNEGASPRGANTRRDPAIPRSLSITGRGVRSGEDFADLMSALMGDVIEGSISPNVANAACNAGRQLLRITEMQYRWGRPGNESRPTLTLAPGRGS
jgi:hypothetical protein